jgi:hypothetical protein
MILESNVAASYTREKINKNSSAMSPLKCAPANCSNPFVCSLYLIKDK